MPQGKMRDTASPSSSTRRRERVEVISSSHVVSCRGTPRTEGEDNEPGERGTGPQQTESGRTKVQTIGLAWKCNHGKAVASLDASKSLRDGSWRGWFIWPSHMHMQSMDVTVATMA